MAEKRNQQKWHPIKYQEEDFSIVGSQVCAVAGRQLRRRRRLLLILRREAAQAAVEPAAVAIIVFDHSFSAWRAPLLLRAGRLGKRLLARHERLVGLEC